VKRLTKGLTASLRVLFYIFDMFKGPLMGSR
jgi:hypothetical protein